MLYSIRMRSAINGPHEEGGSHISGAERIVREEELEELGKELINRALHHSKGKADFINIRIDTLEEEKIQVVEALHITSSEVESYEEGRLLGKALLVKAGISEIALEKAFTLLEGLSLNMRGAIVLDAITGERLDEIPSRGVRVSHMDVWDKKKARDNLEARGLGNIHVQEALVLASKVLSSPGIVAELCWSDDPDYVTGYVSYGQTYHRITKMKNYGSPMGGRVFFVASHTDYEKVRHYLEEESVLVRIGEKG